MLTGTGAFDLSDVALQVLQSLIFKYCLSDMFSGTFNNESMEISCIIELKPFLADSNWQDL